MCNKSKVSVLVISIANPILIGIYQNDLLIDTIKSEGKTSDILPEIFHTLVNKYQIDKVYYVNGPGSYMAIKIAYVFLKTFAIVQNIPFEATDGFKFNHNTPIKALGKKYFFNGQDDKITVDFIQNLDDLKDFELPQKLMQNIFSEKTLPNYHLPAV